MLGKLLRWVGEDNILWGTDSIFYGSPQDQIQAFRAFEITREFQERYGLSGSGTPGQGQDPRPQCRSPIRSRTGNPASSALHSTRCVQFARRFRQRSPRTVRKPRRRSGRSKSTTRDGHDRKDPVATHWRTHWSLRGGQSLNPTSPLANGRCREAVSTLSPNTWCRSSSRSPTSSALCPRASRHRPIWASGWEWPPRGSWTCGTTSRPSERNRRCRSHDRRWVLMCELVVHTWDLGYPSTALPQGVAAECRQAAEPWIDHFREQGTVGPARHTDSTLAVDQLRAFFGRQVP